MRNVFLGVDILRKDDFSGGKYRRIGLKRSVGLSCQKSICIMTWGRRILRAEILKFLSFRQKRSRWHLKLHQRFPKLPCLLSGSKKQPRTKSSRVKVELIIQDSKFFGRYHKFYMITNPEKTYELMTGLVKDSFREK